MAMNDAEKHPQVDLQYLRKQPVKAGLGLNKKLYFGGAALLVVTIFFDFFKSWYFGWNAIAETIEEICCNYALALSRTIGLIAMGWAILNRPPDVNYFSGPILINRQHELAGSVKEGMQK